MQPSIKKIENPDSAGPFRFADTNPLGNSITVETSYGLSKRETAVIALISGTGMGLVATQLVIDQAYRVADLILAGPTDDKSLVDLDKIGEMD